MLFTYNCAVAGAALGSASLFARLLSRAWPARTGWPVPARGGTSRLARLLSRTWSARTVCWHLTGMSGPCPRSIYACIANSGSLKAGAPGSASLFARLLSRAWPARTVWCCLACVCTWRHFSACWAAIADMVRSYSWDAPTVKQRLQLSRIHSWDAPDGALQYGQFGAGHAANSLHSALG